MFNRQLKRACVAAALFSSVWLVPAQAQYAGPSASPSAPSGAQSVAEILKNPVDDQRVTLRGVLLKQVAKEKYMFSDGSGEIRVEIDDDIFPRQRVDEKTKIEIMGEVENDFLKSPEIDVDIVRVLD